MANNKVQLADGSVLIDLTDTTAVASDVAVGSYFYDASGVKQIGTLVVDQTYSITKYLTNVTTSVDDTKVIASNSFFMDLTPTNGYVINNITVTMGRVDITDQVFSPGVGNKAVLANGTYNAIDDNLSGYNRIVVNVPSEAANLGSKTITSNGIYTASSESLDGYSEVTVNVPTSGEPNLQNKSVTVTPTTSSQTQTVSPDSGYDGLSYVDVAVNPIPSQYIVPSGTKSITANGTGIDVSEYASVDVSVPTSGGGSGNATIETGTFEVASNISIAAAGTTISVGFSGHPDIIYCWHDRQDFIDKDSYSAGWWRFMLLKNDVDGLSTVPYIRQNASLDVQSLYSSSVPYIRLVSPNIYDSTDANNLAGKALSVMAYYNYNNANNAINSDGTIKIARYSSASTKVFAGTYHYMAITLPSGIYIPMPV